MAGLRADIGIDLGTSSVLVYVRGKGIVLNEPSVVAINTETDELLAVGEEARDMIGRTPANIVAIRPIKDGVISDYDKTQKMIKHFIQKAAGKSLFKPRIVLCVPSGITEVEKRAVIDSSNQAGAIKTTLIEEPIAGAIGAGIDITEPNGNMIVDIGGGTTDIAVISLGGIVISRSLKVAGDDFDEAIMRFIKKKYNVVIGERSAEKLKVGIGSAYERKKEEFQDIKGIYLVTGLPTNIKVSSTDMLEALREPVSEIIDAILYVLENTPPELSADISYKGILMAGGGSLLYGLDTLIAEKTGIDVNIAEDPVSCVAIGTGESLKSIDLLDKQQN